MDNASAPEPVDLDRQIALAEAEVAAGHGQHAAARLQALIDAPIYDHRLHYALSAAMGACGQFEAQREALKDAQTFHGLQIIADAGVDMQRFMSNAAYAAHLAQTWYGQKLMGPASAAFAQAALKPGASAQTILGWGLSLQHQGRIEEAMTAFSLAVELYPSPTVHEFVLYACFFLEDGVRRHAEEVRRWAERYMPPYDPTIRRFPNRRLKGRRLRVGYVAPSFTGGQLKQFIMPVLENHDPERIEVVLYPAKAETEAGAPARAIHAIGGLGDEDAALMIARDRIDVLIDLWGHTAGGRLGIFALKPAPVQAAWINYVQSTGLAAMDYVIHADGTKAPGDEALFTEKIWRIGPIAAPFRPGPRLDPQPTPALCNGFITFGSFNHPARLNDATVAAWARVLKGRAGSRLLLKYGYFADPVLQAATRARFAAHGVGADRIHFRGHSSGDDYLASFDDMDLALDPSPCPGGTTSSDAVANGVPLLTLRGPDFYSRIGTLRLEPLGLYDLVAESWDDYVDKALSVTADVGALNALRESMRGRFDASPIRDEAGFTRVLEDALEGMFTRWFNGETGAFAA